MSAISVPMLPETAPFTPAQRAWLNGFFAGLFTARSNVAQVAAAPPAPPLAPAPAQADEDFPWHDASISMEERLKLAQGRPQERILMAAMAQLDCGACGYLCQTYSEAIARGEEKDLSKCAPGGKETARKLKELVARGPAMMTVKGRPLAARGAAPAEAPAKSRYDRLHPFPAPLLMAEPLNSAGSTKDTRLVLLGLAGSGLTYKVGDSLGVYPDNCPDTVQWVIDALDAVGSEKVSAPDGALVMLRDALLKHYVVTRPSTALLELLAEAASDAAERKQLAAMVADDGPGAPDGLEVLDLLEQFPSARPPLNRFVEALAPLQPRLYSISSSLKAHPDQVHLTVGVVRFLNRRGRQCKGVASTFLAERVRPGQAVRVFVQPSHGFTLPADGNTPIIMVGPGTGVAPFRAFLQERKATSARGRNWLLFGDQRRDCDFLYRDELEGYRRDLLLSRLETAFSRDQAEKVYVQHRMLENAAEIWSWLRDGAHFYVCGDARRMAADVDAALKRVVAEQGRMSEQQAKAHVADLARTKRYQRDVY